jgi:hypothetical protein
MASAKTAVIEALFLERWDAASGCLPNNAVTLDDVSRAIGRIGATLSQKNPANFMKDVVRRRDSYFRILRMRQRNYRLDRAVVGAICSRPPKLRA